MPKKYVEQVGDEGFKKAPIGAGPYKFVSFTPGLELTMEANDQYWRKKPSVHRLVFKVIPDESTRLAALKRGEIDIAYSIRGELAEEIERTKGLSLKPTVIQAPFWLYFPDQWDPKSPWHDQRVRLAASLAIDRKSYQSGSDARPFQDHRQHHPATPSSYYWQPPAPVYDPAKAKKLLAEAGHPNGFDAGDYYCDTSYCERGRGGDQQPPGRSASAPSCGRWSGRLSSRATRRRATRTSSRAPAAPSATPPRAWRRSW